jgi:hypothetical protein
VAKETGSIVRWEAWSSVCLDSALLMHLKVGQRKGKRATDVRTCRGVSSLLD